MASRIVALGPETLDAFGALFDACGSACFCRYWGFAGNKNEWLERTFTTPRVNLDEQSALVQAGDAFGRGLLAFDPDDVSTAVGWMKLAPRARMTKLRRQGAYRALRDETGTPDDLVWIIGCLLVHPEHRGRGVARELIAAASDPVRAWGGVAIEAYPRGTSEIAIRLHAEEAWMGTDVMFGSLGFEKIAGDPAYPVYRKSLSPPDPPQLARPAD